MNSRIVGLDIARALAIFGMIIVNFKLVLGSQGNEYFEKFVSFFDGKASATFVVLAGIGTALLTKKINNNGDRKIIFKILKRALFLFVLGLSYMCIWPADILHFYGVYLVFVFFFINSRPLLILFFVFLIIIGYPLLHFFLDYEEGWNFETLEYTNFWTLHGFVKNLFFNGFHPILPWFAFFLFGFWYGQQNLKSLRYIKITFCLSFFLLCMIHFLPGLFKDIPSIRNTIINHQIDIFLTTNPMPPFPLYMFNGICFSVILINFSVIIGALIPENRGIQLLVKTGKLALTFYVLHVIIGLGIALTFVSNQVGSYSVEFSLIYSLIFFVFCMTFAHLWFKLFHVGPLEWVMRKLSD